jgi:hypothetical protein
VPQVEVGTVAAYPLFVSTTVADASGVLALFTTMIGSVVAVGVPRSAKIGRVVPGERANGAVGQLSIVCVPVESV